MPSLVWLQSGNRYTTTGVEEIQHVWVQEEYL